MPYNQWIAQHPELEGYPEETKRESYQMYLDQLNDAMKQMSEED